MPIHFSERARKNYSLSRLNQQSFILQFQLPVSRQLTALLTAIDRRLKAAVDVPIKHIGDTVIGLDSLYVQAKHGTYFANADIHSINALLTSLLANYNTTEQQGLAIEPLVVKACYHPTLAPDLESVARAKKLSVAEVIALHTQAIYTVYAIGFMPGFAYLGQLPEPLHIDRKATPREAVPAGSVGLAHNQTGIYPRTSPGGWQIIARTTLNCFDEQAPISKACPFSVGQPVKFEAISLAEYRGFSGE